MLITIFIFIYVLVVVFDFIPIIKQKNRKEITIYSILLLLSFTVAMLYGFGVKLPSIFGFS